MLRVTMRKLAFWMILLFLCMCGCAVAEEIPTLALPSMLQIIEEEAFCGNLSIGKVVVPDGTTEIRSRAFADSSLVAIELPDSLTRIADDAFEGCDQFRLVVQQGSYAYEWAVKNGYIKPSAPAEDFTYQVIDDATCMITGYTGTETELVLPNRAPDGRVVASIGKTEFYECDYLTSVTIPDSVTSIGEEAFVGCFSLTSVTIPDSVASIGDGAFISCINLPSISIPSSVTSIGNDVFNGCENLTDVEIPNGVQSIGEFAFNNCYNLISVTLPDSVTSIGSYAFDDCRALTSIRLPSALSTIEKYTFSNCCSLKELKLPETLTKIEDGAFEKCFSITSFDLPSDLQRIGGGVFSGCTSLVSVNLPDSLSNIGYALFEGCGEISLDVNEGSYAYEWAVMEGYIQLPTSADGFTFTDLDNEYCAIIGYTGDERTLVLPKYSPDGHIVKALGDHAFYEQTSLMSVSMPDSLKEIGAYAFAGCTSLNKVMLPDGLSSIGDNAFAGCASLIRLVLPTGLSSIANKAFTNCSALESVILPDSLESIAENAFDGCGSFMVGVPDHCYAYDWAVQHGYITVSTIQDGFGYYNLDDTYCAVNGYIGEATDVVIPGLSPDGHIVQKVKDEAFYWDKRITSVVMPDSLTHIGGFAFFGCNNLTSVRFSANLESIYDAAFVSTKLTDIVIPGSVEVISESAFHSCISLRSVTIPDSVTSIESYAFKSCSSLTSVTIPDSVTSIEYEAFYGCSSLTSVYIWGKETTINYGSFSSCHPDLIVYGWPDSAAEAWCNDNGVQFKALKVFAKNYWYEIVDDTTCAIVGYDGNETELDLPSSAPDGRVVTRIGSSAFSNCTKLTSVTIPDSVTSIETSAFSGCSNLTSVTIPDSVKSIDDEAFSDCGDFCIIAATGSYAYDWAVKNGHINSMTPSEDFSYEIIDDTTCVLTGYTGTETELVLPNRAPDGRAVTEIGQKAFYKCSSLTSVTIPNSVTSIGDYAFYECSSLTSVTIPDSVTSIGSDVFARCSSLTSLTIPNSVTSISLDVFYNCSNLTSVTIPDSMVIDASYIFNCPSLTEIILSPNNTRYSVLQNVVFSKDGTKLILCPEGIKMTSYTIPDGVTSIGDNAFRSCSSLTSVTIPNSVTSIGDWAFFKCSSLTSVTIPNSVTSISSGAFCWCTSLTSITISNSVMSIGEWAFGHCRSLKSVTIPESVTLIDCDVFNDCISLERVYIPSKDITICDFSLCHPDLIIYGWSDSKVKTWCDKNGAQFEELPKTIADEFTFTVNGDSTCSLTGYTGTETVLVLPDHAPDGRVVTSIGDSLFYNCSSLTSVTIPYGALYIGESAFFGCSSLTSVTIPDSVTNMGANAFSGCSSLTSVTIPDGVTSIGNYTFCRCSGLTSVMIPNSVTSIGDYAFFECSSLTSVTIPDGVTSIGESAFCFCCSLTSVIIPDSVTSIGTTAFFECSSLTSVIIPNGVTSIEDHTFNACINLKSVTIPDSVTSIGDSAFEGCSSLTSVTIPNSVTSIGQSAFSRSKLKSVTIPNSVTSIGQGAFACNNLTSVTIPNSVTSIGDKTFYSCSSLTSVTIPNSVTSIGDYAFYNCSSLTSVTIPNSVTSIGDWAFSYCSSLTSVTISNGVTDIGDWAFCSCSSLTSVTIPNSVTSIGEHAFYSCSSLVIYGHSGSFIEGWCADHGITFAALSYTSISARVLLGNGSALPGVHVSIYEDEEQRYLCSTITMDDSGTWNWNQAIPGNTYWIHLEMEGYTFSSNDFSVTVGNGATAARSVRAIYGGGVASVLTLSEYSWSTYADGGMKLLTIGTSNGWHVTDSPEWTSLYVQENVNNQMVARLLAHNTNYSAAQELLIGVGENTTGVERSGQITISNGIVNTVFEIVQDGSRQIVGTINEVEYTSQGPYSINESVTLHISTYAFQQGVVVVSSPALAQDSVTYFADSEYDFSYLAKAAGDYTITIGVTTNGTGVQYEKFGLDMCTDYAVLKFTVLSTDYNFGGMMPSNKLVDFIASFEGFHPTHYIDTNGLPTIGYGHAYSDLSSFKEPITEKQAKELLWGDLAKFSRNVNREMDKYGITLTQQQFDAFVSCWYNNISGIVTDHSCRLWTYYKQYGSFSAIPAEKIMEGFVTWHGCSKKDYINGLYRRRANEAQIFIYGEYSSDSAGVPDWMDGHPIWRPEKGIWSYDVPDGWVSPLIRNADYVHIESNSAEYAYSASNYRSLPITSSGAWTAVASHNWITLNTSSGLQNSALSYSVAANTSADERTGTITVTCGSQSAVFTITQHGTQNAKMDIEVTCSKNFYAGEQIMALAKVVGGSGNYRYSYELYRFDGTKYVNAGSNSLISGSGRQNILTVDGLAAGSYKMVVQVIDYEGEPVENCVFFDVKQREMNMIQPNVSGTVLPDSFKFEWTEVNGADDYVLRIRDLTTGDLVIGDESGNGVHTANETYYQYTNISALQQHVLRIWVGAYRNNILVGQSQVIATAGPIPQISFVSPVENAHVESGNLQITWDVFNDNMNTVALYRVSVRELETEGEPLIVDNVNVDGSITSYTLSGSAAIVAGHKYRVWVGAFTKEGGRIAQKQMNIDSMPEQSDDPATTGKNPSVVIQQNVSPYKTISYGGGNHGNIGYSGCGLVAVVNAFMYKSGKTDCAESLITTLASACEKKGTYSYNSLCTTITNVFSSYLSISTTAKSSYSISDVRSHLKDGGVAIIGTSNSKYYDTTSSGNHFVAIVAVRENNGVYEYLMLDSAIENNIGDPKYISKSGWGWVSEDNMKKLGGGVNLVTFKDYKIKGIDTGATIDTVDDVQILADDSFEDVLKKMQKSFPSGYHWNHNQTDTESVIITNGKDSKDKSPFTTSVSETGSCKSGHNGDISCNREPFHSRAQCLGFAMMLGWAVSGKDVPNIENSGVGVFITSSNIRFELDSIAKGDIIWYKKTSGDGKLGHKIFVTDVNGDDIEFADCNEFGGCTIAWGKTITKDDLSNTKFYKILHYNQYADSYEENDTKLALSASPEHLTVCNNGECAFTYSISWTGNIDSIHIAVDKMRFIEAWSKENGGTMSTTYTDYRSGIGSAALNARKKEYRFYPEKDTKEGNYTIKIWAEDANGNKSNVWNGVLSLSKVQFTKGKSKGVEVEGIQVLIDSSLMTYGGQYRYYPKEAIEYGMIDFSNPTPPYSLNNTTISCIETIKRSLFGGDKTGTVTALWGEYYLTTGVERTPETWETTGLHEGIDVQYSTTANKHNVYSLTDGVVRIANGQVQLAGETHPTYRQIMADYGVIAIEKDDYWVIYMHCSSASVQVGDQINKNMAIGLEGNKSKNPNGTAVHVHLSVWPKDKYTRSLVVDSDDKHETWPLLNDNMFSILTKLMN